jgi:hypothetical protein
MDRTVPAVAPEVHGSTKHHLEWPFARLFLMFPQMDGIFGK